MPQTDPMAPPEDHAKFIWRNGELVPYAQATIHVNAVGHRSVASIFEGIKAYWNPDREQLYVFRLKEHLVRFLNSIRVVRNEHPYSYDDLHAAVLDTLRANEVKHDVYIRPWTFAKGFHRRVVMPAGSECEVLIDMWPFQSHMMSGAGCTASVSSWVRFDDAVQPVRAKAFSNYHSGRMAQMEANLAGYDYPILLNNRHKVTETPGSCVGLVRKGVFFTPSVTSGVLDSVTRDTFLAAAPEWAGVRVEQREVDRSELYEADEVFFMGTGREIYPVLSVDQIPVANGQIGPVTKVLDTRYNNLVRALDPAHEEWRTPVW